MRGDEPDGATVQLCLLLSVTAMSDVTAVLLAVENTSLSAGDVTVTSPADDAADSDFLADKSITSGSHNFFTWCITPAQTTPSHATHDTTRYFTSHTLQLDIWLICAAYGNQTISSTRPSC